MWVICDLETNALVKPDKVWLALCKDVDTGKDYVFKNVHEDPEPFKKFILQAECIIGHKFISYDYKVIRDVLGIHLDPNIIIDTLVVSRLLNFNIPGGHSLDAWGERLGLPKLKFNNFHELSEEMITYGLRDTELNLKLFKYLQPWIESDTYREALRLEHETEFICLDLTDNGFKFNKEDALELYAELTEKLQTLQDEIHTHFPPKPKFLREITPRQTKFGTISLQDFRWLPEPKDLSPFTADAPFSLFDWEPFNPGSQKQVVERLNAHGWQPTSKTKAHQKAERERDAKALEHYRVYGWKVDEENLATLPPDAPEGARKLTQWLVLSSRKSNLETWLSAYSEEDGRIHGNFNGIGAWTHRMSHSDPNQANIPSVVHPPKGRDPSPVEQLNIDYNWRMRKLWTVDPGHCLLGVDADGIQLRILAHLINDPAFTKSIVEGKKEDGTDAHSLNQKALGPICQTRDDAKTFIYAFLLGAGIPKLAQILKCSVPEARKAYDDFLDFYPGLRDLKEKRIPQDAARGYFVGIDGRLVPQDSEHLMLAGYLQNGESIIMKKANTLWRERLRKEKIWFKQVDFVHDEWQTELEDELTIVKTVASIQIQSIIDAGEYYKLNCPLDGSSSVGYNWYETH